MSMASGSDVERCPDCGLLVLLNRHRSKGLCSGTPATPELAKHAERARRYPA